MKRYFKRLTKRFVQWIKKLTVMDRIIYSCMILIGITIAIIVFVSIDKVPATTNDYKPLVEKATAIEENVELLLKTDGNFNVKDEVITINFENSECRIIAKYDQNLKILSITKQDNSLFWIFALMLALAAGAVGGLITVFFLLAVILIVLFLSEVIFLKIFKKIKSKFKKE